MRRDGTRRREGARRGAFCPDLARRKEANQGRTDLGGALGAYAAAMAASFTTFGGDAEQMNGSCKAYPEGIWTLSGSPT